MTARKLSKNLQRGLVLWLDGSTNWTTAYDKSGSGNDFTINNSPTTQRILGQKWWDLNGTNQYLSRSYTPSFTAVTVNMWINVDIVNGFVLLDDSNQNLFAQITTWGYINFATQVNGYNNLTWTLPFVGTWKWVMATLTYDWVTKKIYSNWVFDTSVAKTWTITTSSYIYIWAYQWLWYYADWRIIYPMIWNRALSQSEIRQLYQETFIK